MEFELGNSRSSFLIIAITAFFGFLIIILAYYIFASRSSKKRQALIQEANNRAQQAKEAGKQTIKKDPLVGVKPADVAKSDVPVGFREKGGPPVKQVYNVGNNIYSYHDADAVCKAFGGELADYYQIVDSYKKGADWCNYGWSKGQLALFPTQYKTWKKMQTNKKERRNDCGQPGVNGGYFENPNKLFGVNCYGIKPSPRDHERTKHKFMSDADIETARKVQEIRSKMDSISVLPFNEDKWSGCN